MTTVDGVTLRQRLGRADWNFPQPFGPDGWRLNHLRDNGRIIVTTSDLPPGMGEGEWTHASWSWADRVPTYDELCRLHAAVWGPGGWSYQVFAAAASHVNIHAHALHLWGRADGARALPDFGYAGTI